MEKKNHTVEDLYIYIYIYQNPIWKNVIQISLIHNDVTGEILRDRHIIPYNVTN